jgi:putative endopeptidase
MNPLSRTLGPAPLLRCGCVFGGGGRFRGGEGGRSAAGADASVRPQDDLFRAVNGGWLQATEIPADKSTWGSFVELADQSDQRVRKRVEQLAAQPGRRGSAARKVGEFFASHVDTAAIDHAGMAPLAGQLAAIDRIASLPALAAWMGRQQGWINTPVVLWVLPDYKQPTNQHAITWQGGLGLPDRDYYLNTSDERLALARAAYQRYLRTLARHAGQVQPAQAARRVLAIEQRIAQAHWPAQDNRDPVKIYNPVTPAGLAALAPGFDWAAFLRAAQLGGQDRLSLSQPSMVTAIAALFAEVPLDDWKLYFKLRCLDAAAPVLPRALRAAHFAFHGRALTGATRQRPRWQAAISEMGGALGEAIGQLYVAEHFPAAHKARMEAMVGQLLDAYRESIASQRWMSPPTQALALHKLSRIGVKIGYPEQWRGHEGLVVRAGDALGNQHRLALFEWAWRAAKAGQAVDRGEWALTPQTVNAYYDPSLNEIVFPAAILQPPFFDMDADDAANFGAIGAVIGHEISHGFDDQGSRFDGDGVLRDWWTADDRKAFDALGERLVKQFAGYQPLPGRPLNGRLTLGENIADLSGLQIAFKAWQRSLGGSAAPVIDGRSGAQRFFIGWARAWRSKCREERALQLLTVDPHSPPEFRANGAAVNHDGFHEAFGTRRGDAMYKPAGQRTRVW